MESGLLFTLVQSLQMVALAPCILVIFFLVVTTKHPSNIVVPILYFMALSSGFIGQLMPAFLQYEKASLLSFVLNFSDSLVPALSFLLIIQFIHYGIPPWQYWLVLALPVFGGAPFIYGSVYQEQLCLNLEICVPSETVWTLSNIVGTSLIFALLVFIVSRSVRNLDRNVLNRSHKYAIIIALVASSLCMLAIDLGYIMEHFSKERYLFAEIMIKIAFVYMVLTSIFRIFTEAFDTNHLMLSYHKSPLTQKEEQLAKDIEGLLKTGKVYRDLMFCRTTFADRLGIKEHKLSRIVNLYFGKSFSEIANEFRIEEAKDLLVSTNQPVTVISFDVGFNSITSFNRVFKDFTGLAPSQYREEKKGI